MKATSHSLIVILAVAAWAGQTAAAEWSTPEARARWRDVSGAIFGDGAAIGKAAGVVKLEAPATAMDATLVPVTIRISLSTNPVIAFLYKPKGDEPFKVTGTDSDGTTWTQKFAPLQTMN